MVHTWLDGELPPDWLDADEIAGLLLALRTLGDPAVDVMIAWKLVAPDDRDRFKEVVGADDATWLRARGWALSQALGALSYYTLETYPPLVHEGRRWLAEVLAS